MSSAIAAEAQRLVRDAATPIPSGETVKGQLRRAARALGYPVGSWKISSAWYGRAGSWSAAAFEELRARHRVWAERQAKQAEAQSLTSAVVFSALADRLEATDRDFHLEDIARLRNLASRLRGKADGEVT